MTVPGATVNPATAAAFAEVVPAEVDAAMGRAAVAPRPWADTGPDDRARLARRFGDQPDALDASTDTKNVFVSSQ